MGHTLHCGQRAYTMPSVVIPTATKLVGSIVAVNFSALQITNIKPPSGIVISAAPDSAGVPMLFRFTTEQGSAIFTAPPSPTLFLSDSIIQAVEYGTANLPGFLTWYVVQDVAYLAEVKDAWGRA